MNREGGAIKNLRDENGAPIRRNILETNLFSEFDNDPTKIDPDGAMTGVSSGLEYGSSVFTSVPASSEYARVGTTHGGI